MANDMIQYSPTYIYQVIICEPNLHLQKRLFHIVQFFETTCNTLSERLLLPCLRLLCMKIYSKDLLVGEDVDISVLPYEVELTVVSAM